MGEGTAPEHVHGSPRDPIARLCSYKMAAKIYGSYSRHRCLRTGGPRHEVARALSACDLVVIPSLWIENLPLVLLHARAGSDVAANTEWTRVQEGAKTRGIPIDLLAHLVRKVSTLEPLGRKRST